MQRIGTLENSLEKKQMKDNCFLDTNILVYLISADDLKKHEKVKKLIFSNKYHLSISTQNIREFANIALKKSNQSANTIQHTIDVFSSAFFTFNENSDDIIHALKISKRKNFYDALLTVTMKRNGIKIIITENEKDFVDFKGIKTINPFK